MVTKASDIRRIIELHMLMWKDEGFDLLVQESIRCDSILEHS